MLRWYCHLIPTMTLPHLPVEVWRKILDEAISIPTFLDAECLPEVTNPLHVGQPTFDTIYWETEKQRKRLQHVCQSWNTYLGLFEHRYVRIADVFHGQVPVHALYRAIRILYRHCGAGKCRYCFNSDRTFRDLPDLVKQSTAEATGESPRDMKVEILDAQGEGASHVLGMIINCHGYRKMPYLKVIISLQVGDKYRANEESTDNRGWTRVMTLLPTLQFINVTITTNSSDWDEFSASNLTTLSYSIPVPRRSSDLGQWGLPPMHKHSMSLSSLRHIRLPSLYSSYLGKAYGQQQFLLTLGIPTERQIDEGLLRFLTGIGSNLLSLQIGRCFFHGKSMIDEIWDLCPRLVRLDSGFRYVSPPPHDHPIHTISIFLPPSPPTVSLLPRLRGGSRHPSRTTDASTAPGSTASTNCVPTFPSSIVKDWPSLRRLIVQGDNGRWNDIRRLSIRGQKSVCDWLADLARECKKYCIALEDSEGMVFEASGLDTVLKNH